ncbi:MAG TPA: MlaD family protein [Sphingomonadaceae bacterium]|nr:MlaD family protein [Sphingomonadaceae bacterium]
METRSNHILVGGVVLALLAAVLIFTVWLARVSGGGKQDYDIFFKTSVDGLAKGSTVTFSGVPSGQVKEIELMPKQPEFVRVRISVDEKTPILQGTTATIAGVGFTGVSQINLDGAIRGAPRISCPGDEPSAACPFGVPVIPTKPGALGELINNAPKLLEQISTLTERLGELLDDRNQKSIHNILGNIDRLSGALADSAPDIRATFAETRLAIRQAGEAADKIGALAESANSSLGPAGENLRRASESAAHSMAALEGAVNEARPGLRTFSTQTIPEVNQLVRNLNDMAEALTDVARKIDNGGAGGLIGGPKLPDYKPGKHP